MRILIAPDKFKGSLGAAAVAEEIAAGVHEVLPAAEIVLLPVADGGEGTAEAICRAARGTWQECAAQDALGRRVRARFATIDHGKRAVMEMSQAAGLWRIRPNERDVLRATSYGAGELLLAAASRGAEEIIIGLGGSATNDGGFGLARALGFRFFAAGGQELTGAVTDLLRLARIVPPPGLILPRVTAAVDVCNPLLGPRGATQVYGPQKGAGVAEMRALEGALERLAQVAGATFGNDPREIPGAGAAGGLGFGLLVFCRAQVRPGFEVVAEAIGLEDAVRASEIVITGEGKLDAQSLEGKAPVGVARLARKHGRRVYAVVGALDEAVEWMDIFDGVRPLLRPPITGAEATQRAAELIRARAAELAKAWTN